MITGISRKRFRMPQMTSYEHFDEAFAIDAINRHAAEQGAKYRG